MPRADTLIHSERLAVTQYAYAATAASDARYIFLAGSCPLLKDGTVTGVGGYTAQARQALENMLIVLEEAGAGIEDVISTTVLVASAHQPDLVKAWEVVREIFGAHDVPSTLMGVTVLGYPDQLVEVEAVAAILTSPEGASKRS